MLSRRRFLTQGTLLAGLAGLAAPVLTPSAGSGSPEGPATAERLLSLFTRPQSAALVGGLLDGRAEDPQILAARISAAAGIAAGDPPARMRKALAERIAADFADGRITLVAGFPLAETEAGLLALAAASGAMRG